MGLCNPFPLPLGEGRGEGPETTTMNQTEKFKMSVYQRKTLRHP